MIFWGFGGAAVFGTIAYAFKPDTRYVCHGSGDVGGVEGWRGWC